MISNIFFDPVKSHRVGVTFNSDLRHDNKNYNRFPPSLSHSFELNTHALCAILSLLNTHTDTLSPILVFIQFWLLRYLSWVIFPFIVLS
jgi:hypothetical protein